MRIRGMAESLCACPPIPDAAKSLPYGRTECSGHTAAVDHSMSRHPIELSKAPKPLARGANISPPALDVAPAAAAWREGDRD